MSRLDHVPGLGGGAARSGGSLYHLSFRSGSRAGGACAKAAFDYTTRSEEYDDPDRDEAVYTESGNMPEWAADDPQTYWDSADLFERANGRLYVTSDFALPLGLDRDEQIALARAFAEDITGPERLPYTLAIHAGTDEDGQEHNPHAHLMFSERQNDGIERSPEEWFSRANKEHPDQGGAEKSRTFHGRDWVEHARQQWADRVNKALEAAGRSERVDHRSYERQGIDRQPGEHYGPGAAHMVARGEDHDRLDGAAGAADDERTVRAIDAEIARLEATRETLLRDGPPEQDPPRESSSSGRDQSDDHSWGR